MERVFFVGGGVEEMALVIGKGWWDDGEETGKASRKVDRHEPGVEFVDGGLHGG